MKSSIEDIGMLRAPPTKNDRNLNVSGAYRLLVALDRAVIAAECEVCVHSMTNAPSITK